MLLKHCVQVCGLCGALIDLLSGIFSVSLFLSFYSVVLYAYELSWCNVHTDLILGIILSINIFIDTKDAKFTEYTFLY